MTDENSRLNAQAELSKADAARRAAHALADLGLHDDAASRLYYACVSSDQRGAALPRRAGAAHRGVAALLGQHLIKPGLLPASVGRDLAALMGLRSQADYNRHFLLDTASLAEDLERVEQLFSVIGAWVAARGIPAPPP